MKMSPPPPSARWPWISWVSYYNIFYTSLLILITLGNDLRKSKEKLKQAGAELGHAQLKLELGFTSTKIWGIALIITNSYELLQITEHG